jgi:Xaa-Pro aminopeptidase
LIVGASDVKDDAPARSYREILYLPTRNVRREQFTGIKLDASSPDAVKLAGVDEVEPMLSLPADIDKLAVADRNLLRNVWVQANSAPARALFTWTATTLGTDSVPNFKDVLDLTTPLRAIKDPRELDLIRRATDASIAAQRAMMRAIHPGVGERAVTGVLEQKFLEGGCERPSYAPIVGSGKYSTVLHYSDNGATMKDGDVVVVDAACEYSMYASDITRTMPVNGHFTPRQKEIYDIVLGAQRAATDAFVAGKSKINDRHHTDPDYLDTVAWNYINTHGKDLHGKPLGEYFIHGLGHQVGIDVHDPYDYTKPLQKGDVFTIEPGIYIPEEKLGVRIEDVFYVDDNGKLIDLMAALPHTAEDVEAGMKK